MDRRAFVRLCAGTAAAGALAAAAVSVASPAVEVREGASTLVRYVGAHRVGGPAPRGVPYVPVRVNEAGELEGVPAFAGRSVLPWYAYCGHESAPGLREEPAENVLRYHVSPDLPVRPWYAPLAGEPVRPEHFAGDGFGAAFSWRSVGAIGKDVLTGVVVRYAEAEVRRADVVKPPARALDEAEWSEAASSLFARVGGSLFVAASTFCTHFCCLPRYRENPSAGRVGAADRLHCACHDSVYEMREPVRYQAFSAPAA